MPVFSCLRVALTCLIFAGLGGYVRASDLPPGFTIDLPFAASAATPSWLGHPESPAGTFATLDLPITPPNPNASLLVTVFFQEKSGGFLRIGWQNTTQAQVLSDNFYDGIGMSNQRSLLVTPDTMKQAGALVFQCGDSSLGIQRIHLEWLENQTGLVSPAIPDVLVTPADGDTVPALTLDGQPPLADSPAWHDRIVNVPVTDAPLRIEQGVEFSVQLDSVPAAARLKVTEAGLPWGQHLVVWINGQRGGVISPAVPELGDGGYASGDKAATPYVGWREGTLFLPVSTLATGSDTLQFSAESDDPATATDSTNPAPLAVKNVSFQFDYPVTTPASVGTSPSSTSAAATVSTPPVTSADPIEIPDEPAPSITPSPGRSDLLSLPATTTVP